MWREGYEVGLAQGLQPGKVLGVEAAALATRATTAALATAMEGHGATYASMLQDLERGAAHRGRRDRRRGRRDEAGNTAFRHLCTNG